MNLPGAQENMPEKKEQYKVFEALDAYFEVVMKGLSGLVDGDHYFETFAEDAVFESRYQFPGWPTTIRGRTNLEASLAGYGKSIRFTPPTLWLSIGLRTRTSSSSNTRCTARLSQVAGPTRTDSSL
jgi:hypothetical protein